MLEINNSKKVLFYFEFVHMMFLSPFFSKNALLVVKGFVFQTLGYLFDCSNIGGIYINCLKNIHSCFHFEFHTC